MTTAPLNALTNARQLVELSIESAHSRLVEIERRHRKNYASLEKCVKRYMETGVAFATNEAQQAIGLTGQKPKQFFQELAKELGRPMLNSYAEQRYLYGRGYITTIRLMVPRSKGMENLAGGLLLMSTEIESIRDWHTKQLAHSADTRNWRFYFNGREGRTHFLRFMRTCRENPVARIALKLPVLPTE
jgi:hypothetical protein